VNTTYLSLEIKRIVRSPQFTIFTIGIPAQANMVFEAVVVIIICLLQSAEFRARFAKFFRGDYFRRGGPAPGPGEAEVPTPARTSEEVTAA